MYLVRRNYPELDFPRYLDRFFKDFWQDTEQDSVVWEPKIDIKESKDAYQVLADLPGLTKKDIDITLENDILTIKGERKEEEKKDDRNVHHVERTYGSFKRSFTLPNKIDTDNVKAEYKNGVLHLSLPKSEKDKPRQIAIR